MTTVENPYPARAVAVFGRPLSQNTTFSYMHAALRPVLDFLTAFPNEYCALALSGGHGSGKTHLLNWISAEVAGVRHGAARVAYAKTNDFDPVDLYHQIVGNWPRQDLLDVQRSALVALGAGAAGTVRATESAARKITDYESLQRAVEERILDLNAVNIMLREKLVGKTKGNAADTRRRLAAAVGLLDDTTYGESAFAWIRGEAVDGLPNEALNSGLFAATGDAGDTAIFALEALAALFRIAETPMILLIDQIENFLTHSAVPGKSSNLKKLVEQLGSEGAAIVMAGTPAGWERMPRDVGPRLLDRHPLQVGALTQDETGLLLQTPLDAHGHPGKVPVEAVRIVQNLSGGNPREVLRIAHQAYSATQGDPKAFDREVLIRAATDSGTLEDRRVLAMQLLEQVAEAEAVSLSPGGGRDEHWLATPGGKLRILFVVAADASAESGLARDVAALLSAAATESDAATLVIAVGYSSERVRELLANVTDIIEFDELTLKAELTDRVKRLKAAAPEADKAAAERVTAAAEEVAAKAATAERRFADRLEEIDRLLAQVQQSRAEADARVAELIEQRTTAAAEPERQAVEARTRYELREGLDELSEALADRFPGKERHVIRRLLIANEINVKDAGFDYLGSLYLDSLDIDRINFPKDGDVHDGDEAPPPALRALRNLRGEIIRTMRGNLANQTDGLSLSYRNIYIIAVAVTVATFLMTSFIDFMSSGFAGRTNFFEYVSFVYVKFLIVAIIAGGLTAMAALVYRDARSRPAFRHRWLRAELDKIRDAIDKEHLGTAEPDPAR